MGTTGLRGQTGILRTSICPLFFDRHTELLLARQGPVPFGHSFLGDQIGSTDGEFPVAPLILGPGGALFGASLGPGFPVGGEVFEFVF
jgi:hypothetical protein